MIEQRIDEHLDAVDAWYAQCTREYPLSFDEWNASNEVMGRGRGDWFAYLEYCKNTTPLFTQKALLHFDAIDDDDFIGDTHS